MADGTSCSYLERNLGDVYKQQPQISETADESIFFVLHAARLVEIKFQVIMVAFNPLRLSA